MTPTRTGTDMALKHIARDAIPAALAKAERYRLLNDSSSAESICLDVLEIEPENQAALVELLLSITDQFADGMGNGVRRAREVLPRLTGEYERAYYAGIICERRAKAQLRRGAMSSGSIASDWFREAMAWYERAEKVRPAGNDGPILRWNACVRELSAHDDRPVDGQDYVPEIGD